MPVVLTCCSQRKRLPPEALLRAASLPVGKLDDLAKIWTKRVTAAAEKRLAEELYGGRNFALSRDAARSTSSPFYIVSAGLGLVRSTEKVPSYTLTVARSSEDSILARSPTPASAADWWDALTRAGAGKSIRRVIASLRPAVVLAALPSSYLEMIARDLASLPESDVSRLRIFSAVNSQRLPDLLRLQLMPYDGRLDGPDSPVPGTLSDFAARALWDFSTSCMHEAPDGSTKVHAQLVRDRLATWRRPRPVTRRRATDEEIIVVIGKNWERAQGRTSSLLRILRDEAGIACEQGRLSMLAAAVRAKVQP